VIKVGTLAKIRRLRLRKGVPIKEIERRTGLREKPSRRLRRSQMVEPKYPPRVMGLLLLQRVDQFHRAEESHPLAVPLDRLDPDGHSQNAQLAHSLVCATSRRRRNPPTKAYSVLQSN
jgi:hypothetical protein